MTIEKYGNVRTKTPDELEKTASGDILCPLCGATCTVEGQVVICPNDGTKPFEVPVEEE